MASFGQDVTQRSHVGTQLLELATCIFWSTSSKRKTSFGQKSRQSPQPMHLSRYMVGAHGIISRGMPRYALRVEFHFGELFPRVGFIVTNLETDSRAVVRFYNKRGTAEQWIKEGKQAVKMTRLSCHLFRSNEVRLLLSLIAYNLGNLWRGVPSGPGAAEADRRLVLGQLAAAVGEDRRAFDQARPVLLAASGGEPPDAAVVREHGVPDRSAAGAHRIGRGREANRAKQGGDG